MAKKSAKKSPAKKSAPPKPGKSVKPAKSVAAKPAVKSTAKPAAAKSAAPKSATGIAGKLVKAVKKVISAVAPQPSNSAAASKEAASAKAKAATIKAPVATAKKPTSVPVPSAKQQVKPAGPSLAIKSAAPHSMSGKSGLLASQKVAQVAASAGVVPLRKKKKKVLRPDEPPVRLPPPPVTSDSKMQKNRAGLSPKELEHFRDLLLEKRRELLGDVTSMERDALRSGNTNLSTLPVHMADSGTDNYEQEFTLGLVEKERQLLREINVALAKIQDGSYGLCEGTGKPISKPRLEAQPWARYSIEHARALEKPMFRRAY